MARLNTRASTTDSLYRDRTPAGRASASPSPTPGQSFSSDKENQTSSRPASTSNGKRAMVSSTPVPQTNAAGKKRRLAEQGHGGASQRRRTTDAEEEGDEDKRYYDPEQNPEERRKLRQGMRNNARELHERADEFLNNDSSELVGLIDRQNALMSGVKQTSDATMDARFLVSASELTLKKSKTLALGDKAIGVDIDEFVSKCITFMRHGRPLGSDEAEPVSTQARRNRRNRDDSDDEDEDDGNAMRWDVLGERACFPNNRRPTVPSFLLGPLSVQKRVRTTQRRATQRKEQVAPVSKPQDLKAADLERNDQSNLTSQCQRIREKLTEIVTVGGAGVEADADEDMSEIEAKEVYQRHNLATNWEVPLFKFAVNPQSFGQTVENLFYISFLVKDGLVALSLDDDGMPTLRPNQQKSAGEQHASGAQKHQAIFSLDYPTWQKLIDACDIQKPLIPHRQEEATQALTGRGWYG